MKNNNMVKLRIRIKHQALPALLFALNICVSGCAPVAPWQRGTLAKPQMALDPYPAQNTFNGHVYGSREAAIGSSSAGGGGCGCY